MLLFNSRLWAGVLALGCLMLVCSGEVQASGIDFSPNGKQIAFPSKTSINVIFTEGGAVRPLEGGLGGKWAHWSPDGKTILFAVEVSGRPTLKAYNTDRRISSAIGADISRPTAWREDGKRFAAVHIKADSKAEIIQYSLLDSGVSLKTDVEIMPVGSNMIWLPASDDVAYLGADGNVYTVESNEVHKITTSNDVIGLSLSGDSKNLVWSRRGPNRKYILLSVYSLDLKTRSAIRLPFAERYNTINPNTQKFPNTIESAQLSPDGVHAVAMVTVPDAKDPKVVWAEAHLIRADGQNGKVVARDKVASNISVSFSKDGTKLSVLSGTVLKVVDCESRVVKSIAMVAN